MADLRGFLVNQFSRTEAVRTHADSSVASARNDNLCRDLQHGPTLLITNSDVLHGRTFERSKEFFCLLHRAAFLKHPPHGEGIRYTRRIELRRPIRSDVDGQAAIAKPASFMPE